MEARDKAATSVSIASTKSCGPGLGGRRRTAMPANCEGLKIRGFAKSTSRLGLQRDLDDTLTRHLRSVGDTRIDIRVFKARVLFDYL